MVVQGESEYPPETLARRDIPRVEKVMDLVNVLLRSPWVGSIHTEIK